MRKTVLAALVGVQLLCSTTPLLAAPRLTQGPADYVLMPFLGYVSLVAAAQLIARCRRR
ncbi:hypothetical protein DESUT3_04700 [Desulfuromonas versatilis]|uniref:Uncharacterized protein n=1 Tax=Desulfuromonas versatilis TaxID=2802975 RepID=A0ABN6DW70_9BACT|nr:hypothetical protein [Desulfuromonas versatilis]BCR03401.1 hypothetical protein DESUT3_04700 [Desulfuromonas versatilis]